MTNEKKIRVTSLILRVFIIISLITFPIMSISYLYWKMNKYGISALPNFILNFVPSDIRTQIPSLSEMGFSIQAIGYLSTFLAIIIPIVCLGFLERLFKHYQNLQVFSKGAIRCIRNIGLTILLGLFFELVLSTLLFLFLPDSFPVSNQLLKGAFFGSIGYNLKIAAGALIIILISWIMKIGYEIQEEQKHTV